MDRWYLVPPWLHLPFAIRLHHIKLADGPRLPHNHPYTFYSFVLLGWYTEEKQQVTHAIAAGRSLFKRNGGALKAIRDCLPTSVRHMPFEVHEIRNDVYHRITEVSPGGVWTLIVHPRKPKQYDWGFLDTDNTHVDRNDYVRPEGY